MTTLIHLSDEERAILEQCLRAAVEGPFFPEWEFETLIGSSRVEVKRLLDGWSQRPLDDAGLASVVTGVLNNLLGYPHGREAAWSSFITVSPAVVTALLDKLLALRQG